MNGEAGSTRAPRPPGEEKGAVTDMLMQTAQDLKEVGLGVARAYAHGHLKRPKSPPKDK
jgi:hypothetical protein